jgi:hypothetical protein
MHMLATALTFAGAGGLGLAAGLVLDYLGLLGASQDRSPGQLVLAALVLLVSGLLFWVGNRLRRRRQAVVHPRPRPAHGARGRACCWCLPWEPRWRRPTPSDTALGRRWVRWIRRKTAEHEPGHERRPDRRRGGRLDGRPGQSAGHGHPRRLLAGLGDRPRRRALGHRPVRQR